MSEQPGNAPPIRNDTSHLKYTEISKNALTAMRNEKCIAVSNHFQISDGFAYFLLDDYDFDVNVLINSVPVPATGEKKIKFLTSHKLIEQSRITRGVSSCSVCYHVDVYVFGMSCKHNACKKCYGEHITKNIKQGKLRMTCIGCRMLLARESALFWIEENAIINQYLDLELKNITDKYPLLTRCPDFKDCGKTYQVDNKINPLNRLTVHCSCGILFCFECKLPSHPFLSCEKHKQWMLMCAHESANFAKLPVKGEIIIKPCHNCHEYIERGDGCPDMTCGHCKSQYCYHCGATMKEHKKARNEEQFCEAYKERFKFSESQISYFEKYRDEELELAHLHDTRMVIINIFSNILPQNRLDFYFRFVRSLYKLKQHLIGFQCFYPGYAKVATYIKNVTEKSQCLLDVLQWFRQVNGLVDEAYIANLENIKESARKLIQEIEKSGNCGE